MAKITRMIPAKKAEELIQELGDELIADIERLERENADLRYGIQVLQQEKED